MSTQKSNVDYVALIAALMPLILAIIEMLKKNPTAKNKKTLEKIQKAIK